MRGPLIWVSLLKKFGPIEFQTWIDFAAKTGNLLVPHNSVGVIEEHESVRHFLDNFSERNVLRLRELHQVAVKIHDLNSDGKIVEFFAHDAVHFIAADARVSRASNRAIPKTTEIVN